MIEEIIAICQTKEDQQTWVNDINKQIAAATKLSSSSSCSTSPSASTKAAPLTPPFGPAQPSGAPKPPPHAVSSIPYVHLSMYFARLVRKRVITRKVLKKLLYKEFFGRYRTDYVPRRRVHRAEYVIYPEKASVAWISSSSDSSAVGEPPTRLAALGAGPPSGRTESTGDRESTGSERAASFSFVGQPRPTYRTTLQLDDEGDVRYGAELRRCPPPRLNLVCCEDLSRLDDDAELRYRLGDAHNFQRETCQSEPLHGDQRPHSAAVVGFKSFSVNCCSTTLRADVQAPDPDDDKQPRYCSSYRISAPRRTASPEPVPVRRYHSTLSVEPLADDERPDRTLEGCDERLANDSPSKLSLRSSDSGLADITSPFTGRQTRDDATNTGSGSSGNFDTTPYSSTSDDKYAIEQRLETSADQASVTFKSGMYAHWWMKTKIPMSALRATAATSRFNSNTGKLSQRNPLISYIYVYTFLFFFHIQCVYACSVLAGVFRFYFFFFHFLLLTTLKH